MMSGNSNQFDPLPAWSRAWQAFGKPLPARWPGEMTLVSPQANQDPQQWGVMEHQWWHQWRQQWQQPPEMPSLQSSTPRHQPLDDLPGLTDPQCRTVKKRKADQFTFDGAGPRPPPVETYAGPNTTSPVPPSSAEPPSKRRIPFATLDVNAGVCEPGGLLQNINSVALDAPRYYDPAPPSSGAEPTAWHRLVNLSDPGILNQTNAREDFLNAHRWPPPSSGTPPLSVFAAPEMPPAAIPAPEEPVLCKEQADLVDLIVREHKNVFYTGSAGCGKSTVLKAFTSRLRAEGKKVYVVAPTGRAALQIGGMTTWTYAGMTPDSNKRKLDELRFSAKHTPKLRERFRETDVLVIDEISMVENFHFQRINERMKGVRRNSPEEYPGAFGGVQVIVTGDFCQLPPVKPFQHCLYCGKGLKERSTAGGITYVCPNEQHGPFRDEDKWAFKSQAWEECDFVHVNLKTIHRQNDQSFIKMLQKCRIGLSLTPTEIDTLMDHPCRVNNATKIYSTREEVRRVNQAAFSKLRAPGHIYNCLDNFRWRPELHPELQSKQWKGPDGTLVALADHRYETRVEFKAGMLVVLLHNLDLDAGLCNGSQGIICGFEEYDPAKLPKQVKIGKKDDISEGPKLYGDYAAVKEVDIKHFINYAKDKLWPRVRFHNGITRTIYADCSINTLGDEEPFSLLSRTQIPLAAAWAMTIHKSQSLTLDRVIVCLNRAFEQGQVYVALSRATGLQGLKIEGSTEGLQVGLGGNREVQRFLREKFGALNGFLVST